MFKISRNAPCICNSNLKYKKCCLNKATINDISNNITVLNYLNDHEFLDGRAVLSKDDHNFLTNYVAVLQDASNNDTAISETMIKQLYDIYQRTPHHPTVLNHIISTCYIKEDSISEKFLEELLARFPQNIIGLRIKSLDLLKQKSYDEAYQIFGRYNNIQELFPHRTIFHIKEIFFFHEGLVMFHLHNNTPDGVIRHYNNLNYAAQSFDADLSAELYQLKQQIDFFYSSKIIDSYLSQYYPKTVLSTDTQNNQKEQY